MRACAALALAAGMSLSAAPPAAADIQLAALGDLARLSIEDLGDIEITSVSRRAEPVGQAPSAVYVITNEDVRRAGSLTLPEALRLAPSLHVARIDALDYSITPRGFGGFESANKLLVLIDGRSVYSPLFSGVDWDQAHVMLDDLDRIEVVSGPGGVLWGANAVNGVINVVSRSSFDTQGLFAAGAAGTLDSDVRLRYGGALGRDGAFRVSATAYDRGALNRADGSQATDGWEGYQLGFRGDWRAGASDFTLQGDLHDNAIDQSVGLAGYVRGANLLGRWTHDLGGAGQIEVQAYFDRVRRQARLIYDALDTYDVEMQHSFSLGGGRHRIVWGGGYRIGKDQFRTLVEPQALFPPSRRTSIANVFMQDEIRLGGDLSLIAGLKLEDNSYTRLEPMPSVRLAWRPAEDRLAWAAVSRVVRNPSRIERDFTLAGVVVPGFFEAESLIAYEAGYRTQVFGRASLSASVFYNDYDDLRTNDLAAPATLPIHVANTMKGRTIGVELWGTWDVRPWWRLSGGASYLNKDFELKRGSLDIAQFESAGVDPDGWVKLRSQFQLSRELQLDVNARAYDDVPTLRAEGYQGADGYAELDLRLAWRVNSGLELSLAAFNLLHDQHEEASETRRTEIPRSAYLGLRWAY
jgi:iron complex outermembrane receptor protein